LVSGENRSNLLTSVAPNILVKKNHHEVTAFKIPDLGTGFMVSKDPEFGIEMIRQYSNLQPILVFPEANEVAERFAKSQNLEFFRDALKMYVGAPAAGKSEWVYGRIGGNMG